jgi:septum site-determining protein MinC
VAQILSIAAEVGIKPYQVFATNDGTRSALQTQNVRMGYGRPMTLPVGPHVTDSPAAGEESAQSAKGDPAEHDIDESEQPDSLANDENGEQCSSQPVVTADGAKPDADGKSAVAAPPAILYLRQTLRSGQSVSHKGHLIIVGDVNPGAEVVADGDITVWGSLRGIAHAGINGDVAAEIRALRLEPIQLRIAHAIARSPDRPRKSALSRAVPETARIVNGTIRIIPNNPE